MSTRLTRFRFMPLLIIVWSVGCDSSAFSAVDERLAIEGVVRLRTVTTGSALDPDGYVVLVDGARSRRIGVNDTTTFSGLAAGTHDVRLTGMASNCSLAGASPRTVTIVDDAMASVRFDVACTFVVGRWQIAFTTDQEGNCEVHVMNAYSCDSTNVPHPAALERNPAWSDKHVSRLHRPVGVPR